jgi:uncharacterized protein YjbJ (UPF0337 family)
MNRGNRATQLYVLISKCPGRPGRKKKESQMGEMIDKVKGAANQAAGKVKKAVGDATNDPALEAKGAAQELKGKAQQLKGDAKGAVNKL